MWYDTCRTRPVRRSPLETIFVYIYLRRAEQELMSTRAIIQALVAQAPTEARMKPAIVAFEEYFDAMMPQLEKAAEEQDEAKKALIELTKHPLKIGLSSLYKKQADAWKKTTKMKVPAAKIIGVRKRRRAGAPRTKPKPRPRAIRPKIPGAK
jgi:phosphoglycolate phosphatase-like HAD superfamily hydrolase